MVEPLQLLFMDRLCQLILYIPLSVITYNSQLSIFDYDITNQNMILLILVWFSIQCQMPRHPPSGDAFWESK